MAKKNIVMTVKEDLETGDFSVNFPQTDKLLTDLLGATAVKEPKKKWDKINMHTTSNNKINIYDSKQGNATINDYNNYSSHNVNIPYTNPYGNVVTVLPNDTGSDGLNWTLPPSLTKKDLEDTIANLIKETSEGKILKVKLKIYKDLLERFEKCTNYTDVDNIILEIGNTIKDIEEDLEF